MVIILEFKKRSAVCTSMVNLFRIIRNKNKSLAFAASPNTLSVGVGFDINVKDGTISKPSNIFSLRESKKKAPFFKLFRIRIFLILKTALYTWIGIGSDLQSKGKNIKVLKASQSYHILWCSCNA